MLRNTGIAIVVAATMMIYGIEPGIAQSGLWPPILSPSPSANDAPAASAVLLPGKRLAVNAVAVDAQDNIYVAGSGDAHDVPGLDRGFDATPDGGDAFVAKLDRNGTVVWATYLGGTDQRSAGRVAFLIPDVANAIAIDAAGQVYVAGTTSASNFPVIGGFQASRAGPQDAFIAKLSADGRRLLYSSYLGAVGDATSAHGIAVGAAGDLWVAAWSTSGRMTTTRDLSNGNGRVTVIKLNPAGAPVWSARLPLTEPGGFAVDDSGRAYLSGPRCESRPSCAHQLLRLDPSGSSLRTTAIPDRNADVSQSALALLPMGRAAFTSVAFDPLPERNGWSPKACLSPISCGDAFVAIVGDSGEPEIVSYLGIGEREPRITSDLSGRITVSVQTSRPGLPVMRALLDHHVDGPVYASRDRGGSWRVEGGQTMPSRGINDLVFNPSRNSVYAVETGARLLESTDELAAWRVDSEFDWYRVAVDTRQPSIRYGISGDHVYRHDDGAAQWRLVSRSASGTYRRTVVVSPHDSSVWIAGNAGVAMSPDGGQTWFDRSAGLPNLQGTTSTVDDVAFDPSRAGIVYALTQAGLYRTPDNGLSWQRIETGLSPAPFVKAMAFDPLAANTIYLATLSGLLRSADNGQTWSPKIAGTAMTVVRTDHMKRHIVYAGGVDADGRPAFFRSIDHGENWHRSSAGLDLRYAPSRLVVDPRDSLSLYLSSTNQATAPYIVRLRPGVAGGYAPEFASYLGSGEIRSMATTPSGTVVVAMNHSWPASVIDQQQIVTLRIAP
ncbi:MAG: hypothetical protein ABI665_00770 [Vicinamibacterales bacterium]